MRSGGCASGQAALEMIRRAQRAGDPYRFLILDYHLADMDGAVLARALRADASLSGTVIVMLTSAGLLREVRNEIAELVDARLLKPVRQSVLLSTLAASWSKGVKTAPPSVPIKREDRIAGLRSRLAETVGSACLRVLIAEDNPINQRVASRMLERIGLRADVAANGREAVDMHESTPYDLIFMDCQMPEMDGYQATGEIRRREGAERRVTIVAMTAEAMAGCRERCLEAGMDSYISKPVTLDALCDTLQQVVPAALASLAH
jgi:CheY-like chemotaxis protein